MRPELRECCSRQGWRCDYCGRPMRVKGPRGSRPTIDHKTPIWSGGQDVPENRVAACDDCNQLKGSLDAETFRAHRKDAFMLRNLRMQVDSLVRSRARARRRSER